MRNTVFQAIAVCAGMLMLCSTLEAQRIPRPNSILRMAARTVAQPVRRSADNNVYGPHSNRYPYVIARPEDREWIRSTPIEQRPNRPLHFWGNSRRRGLSGAVAQPQTVVAGSIQGPPIISTPTTVPTPSASAPVASNSLNGKAMKAPQQSKSGSQDINR